MAAGSDELLDEELSVELPDGGEEELVPDPEPLPPPARLSITQRTINKPIMPKQPMTNGLRFFFGGGTG